MAFITVSGYVTDGNTGKPLIGALIQDGTNPGNSQYTGENGDYTFTTSDPTNPVTISYPGYNNYVGNAGSLGSTISIYPVSPVVAAVQNYWVYILALAAIVLLYVFRDKIKNNF